MIKRYYIPVVILFVLLFGVSAQAELKDMHDGTIYDTDTQLSWLQDANYARATGFDADGRMTWAIARNNWIATLNAGSGFAGFTNWRLPTTAQPDVSCSNNFNPGGDFPLQYYGFRCAGGEMGHLYYTAGITSSTPGPFTNLQAFYYWSGTEFAPNPDYAWNFNFTNGYQINYDKSIAFYALAVRPGERTVPATPVHASGTAGMIALTLAGLMIYVWRLNMKKA